MKTLSIIVAVALAGSWCSAKDIAWTHFAEEGEDATSTHCCFYQSNGDSVERIGWVWVPFPAGAGCRDWSFASRADALSKVFV